MERIYQTITEIEEKSAAEIVVIRHSQSSDYKDLNMLSGVALAFVAYTMQMFMDMEIDPYIIYLITIASFVAGYALVSVAKPIKSMLISRKRKNRNVEIYARALFQKGGIHLTAKHIGILVYCSDLEKTSTIIVDNGVETQVPHDEMGKVADALGNVYKNADFEANISQALGVLSNVLQTYMPSTGKTINEIPDNLKIIL